MITGIVSKTVIQIMKITLITEIVLETVIKIMRTLKKKITKHIQKLKSTVHENGDHESLADEIKSNKPKILFNTIVAKLAKVNNSETSDDNSRMPDNHICDKTLNNINDLTGPEKGSGCKYLW